MVAGRCAEKSPTTLPPCLDIVACSVSPYFGRSQEFKLCRFSTLRKNGSTRRRFQEHLSSSEYVDSLIILDLTCKSALETNLHDGQVHLRLLSPFTGLTS